MPRWLVGGRSTGVAVAICDRCKMKRFLSQLSADPNSPGLRVCDQGCVDQYDPWRLPARVPERVTLHFPRPDLSLTDEEAQIDVIATEDLWAIQTEDGEYIWA